MSDGSLASQVEQYVVAQLVLQSEFAVENGGLAEVYPGSTAPSGERLVAELVANRTTYACVLFVSDTEVPLEGGESGWDATYLVLIASVNKRPGLARTGETEGGVEPTVTFKGVNYFRDVLRNRLHNKRPNVNAGGFGADAMRLAGTRVVYESRDAYILEATLIVREMPWAV